MLNNEVDYLTKCTINGVISARPACICRLAVFIFLLDLSRELDGSTVHGYSVMEHPHVSITRTSINKAAVATHLRHPDQMNICSTVALLPALQVLLVY